MLTGPFHEVDHDGIPLIAQRHSTPSYSELLTYPPAGPGSSPDLLGPLAGSDWSDTSASEVLAMEFPWSRWGKRGLCPEAVNAFRKWVAESVEQAHAENQRLRSELEKLSSFVQRTWGDIPDHRRWEHNGHRHGTVVEAVELVSKANTVLQERERQASEELAQLHLQIATARRELQEIRTEFPDAGDYVEKLVAHEESQVQRRLEQYEEQMNVALEAAHAEAEALLARAQDQYDQLLPHLHRKAWEAARDVISASMAGAQGATTVDPALREALDAYLETFQSLGEAAVNATARLSPGQWEFLLSEEGHPDQRTGEASQAAPGRSLAAISAKRSANAREALQRVSLPRNAMPRPGSSEKPRKSQVKSTPVSS